jgi:hypothetical protein
VNSEHDVTILLQLEKTSTEQMLEIKRDEMSWLRVFLVMSGATVAWSVQRWFAKPSVSASDGGLVWAVLIFSSLATIAFYFHFLLTRWSYYGVSARLMRIQEMLRLYDGNAWAGARAPFSRSEQIGMVKDFRSWWKITKPHSSFATRLVYIFGSNVMICIICFYATKMIGKSTSSFLLLELIILNILLVALFLYCDFRHFHSRAVDSYSEFGL